MKKLPEIKTKIANDTLGPYFDQIFLELMALGESQRDIQLQRYMNYLENTAQEAKSTSIRIQIRINLKALLDKLGTLQETTEVNVRPKPNGTKYPRFGEEAYYEIFDKSGLDL